MEQTKYNGVLELTFSSFSENGVREEVGTEHYRAQAHSDGDVTYLGWTAADGRMTMEFQKDLVVVLREGEDASYRMELEFAKETLMELETPHGVLQFSVRASDLTWHKTPDFPEHGGMDFLLVYDMLDRGHTIATRMLAGKVTME